VLSRSKLKPLWRAGLPRVGLRSSPNKATAFLLVEPGDWF